jgi:hypothetical protein
MAAVMTGRTENPFLGEDMVAQIACWSIVQQEVAMRVGGLLAALLAPTPGHADTGYVRAGRLVDVENGMVPTDPLTDISARELVDPVMKGGEIVR